VSARAAVALAAAMLAIAASASRPAAATEMGPRSVTVFQPADAGDALVEVATRTWAELVAGGYAARIVECSVSSGKCRNAGWRGRGATATVATFEYRGDTLIEVTAAPDERGDPHAVLEVVRAEENGIAPKVLAIRAVELLRATWLEAMAEPAEDAPAPTRVAPAPAATVTQVDPPDDQPAGRAPPEGWWLALGAARLTTSSRVDDGYGVVARGGYRWPSGGGLSLLLAAIELTPDVQVFEGTVAVHQEMALVEGSMRFRGGSRLQPYLTGGLGGYHLGMRGNVAAQPGLVAQDADAWQLVVAAGGGAEIVFSGVGLFAEGQVMAAGPQVLVAAQREEIGSPRLLITLGLQSRF
jgi:hypothetical protein